MSRAYHAAVAEEVRHFGGYVAKSMGSAVLVSFGYPKAVEDDAERAVRAGLALVKRVGQLDIAGEPLAIRIGVATGLVVVGDLAGVGGALEHEVVGEASNLARRLEAMAKPGAIWQRRPRRRAMSIGGGSTRRAVASSVIVRRYGPARVRTRLCAGGSRIRTVGPAQGG